MSGPGVGQAMHPHGVGGRLVALAMEWINTPAYRRAAELIGPRPGDSVLEVGFGTGALMASLAPRIAGGLLAGIDGSGHSCVLADDSFSSCALIRDQGPTGCRIPSAAPLTRPAARWRR